MEDILILTKDDVGRFQLYTKLLKSNQAYNFRKDKVLVQSGNKYHYDNNARELEKERENLKRK